MECKKAKKRESGMSAKEKKGKWYGCKGEGKVKWRERKR